MRVANPYSFSKCAPRSRSACFDARYQQEPPLSSIQILGSLQKLERQVLSGGSKYRNLKKEKILILRFFSSTARYTYATSLRAELSRDNIHPRHQQMTPAPPKISYSDSHTSLLPYHLCFGGAFPPSLISIHKPPISSGTSIPHLSKSFFPTRILPFFLNAKYIASSLRLEMCSFHSMETFIILWRDGVEMAAVTGFVDFESNLSSLVG